jgi:hypothetical protein
MKLNIPRIFEKSKLLTTEVGQQISEFLDFMTDFSEQVTRALRNQITIADNMDAIVSEVSVSHETESIVYTGGKTPMGITVLKVSDKTYAVDQFRWYIDDSGNAKIWVSFSPLTTANVTVKLAIYFN